MRVAIILFALALPCVAHAGPMGSELTMTTNFMIGSVDDRGRDAFAAPGGHFDLGIGNRVGRIAFDVQRSMWTREDVDELDPDRTGSFGRLGVTLRGNVHNFDFGPAKPHQSTMHVYLEVGTGKQWLRGGASQTFTRNDVSFGIGMQQVAHLGGGIIGGDFEMRFLVSRDATDRNLACAGAGACGSDTLVTDVAMLFGMGLVFGS
jgi:hypothetical protein